MLGEEKAGEGSYLQGSGFTGPTQSLQIVSPLYKRNWSWHKDGAMMCGNTLTTVLPFSPKPVRTSKMNWADGTWGTLDLLICSFSQCDSSSVCFPLYCWAVSLAFGGCGAALQLRIEPALKMLSPIQPLTHPLTTNLLTTQPHYCHHTHPQILSMLALKFSSSHQ